MHKIIRLQVIRGHKLLALAVRFGKRSPFCLGYAPTREAQAQLRYQLETDPAWWS